MEAYSKPPPRTNPLSYTYLYHLSFLGQIDLGCYKGTLGYDLISTTNFTHTFGSIHGVYYEADVCISTCITQTTIYAGIVRNCNIKH